MLHKKSNKKTQSRAPDMKGHVFMSEQVRPLTPTPAACLPDPVVPRWCECVDVILMCERSGWSHTGASSVKVNLPGSDEWVTL